MPRGELSKKDTPQELMVLNWVRDTGIGANPQEDFPPYVVDVYVPDLQLAIEIDGPLHLSKRDKKRDEILASQGIETWRIPCLLYTSPSPRDGLLSRMPSSA